jgi:hypothetical protein
MKLLKIFGIAFLIGICQYAQAHDIFACPRCRRIAPKGPKKRPHPGFAKKKPALQSINFETMRK